MADADSERFTRLYRDHYDRVLAYAMRRAPAEVAKEAVDETFLIAWRKLSDLPHRVLPWLLVVARNAVNQQFRGPAGRRPHPRAAPARSRRQRQRVGHRADRRAAGARRALGDRPRRADAHGVGRALRVRRRPRRRLLHHRVAVRLHRARRRLRDALARIDADDTTGPLPTVQEVR